MTLRQQLKIPKYGLFYFDSDQTVSVVPMSKVRKVLDGDHKKSGSVVELMYGSVLQRAEIIGVDDDPSTLDILLLEYTTDPKNSHRFPPVDDDQEQLLSDADSKEQEDMCVDNTKVKKKKGKGKGKASDKGKTSAQKKQPKGKKPKEREQATVVTQIDPAVSTTTCAAVDVVTAGPSSVEDQDAPTVPDSFPTASLSDSLAVPSTPVLASEPSSPATPPRDRLLASFHSGSPSISILSTKSTPRQLPALPRRLTYTPASTSLYSDWSAESHDKFSPRYTPSEQYMYSTPASRHSPQLSPFRSHRHPSTASPEWYSSQLPGGSTYARSFISYQQHVDSAEIQQTLRRLETKVDHLTKLLETSSNRPASYIPAARQPRTVEMFVPVSNTINSMDEAEDHELLPDNQDGLSKKESLLAIRARASSSMNFAVRLLREFFLPGELKGKNVSGMRGKEQLDPARILKIKNYVYEFYPTPPSEKDTVWRECRKAIDSYLRKAFRSS